MLPGRVVGAYRDAFSGLARATWLLALVAFINRAGSMVLPFLSLYLTRTLGFSLGDAGHVLAAFGLGSIVGTQIGGWLTDRIGASRVMQLCFVCMGAGYLVLSQMTGLWSMIVVVASTSVFTEAVRPAFMVAVNLSSEPATRARSLALLRLALNLGMTVGPSIGGLVIVRYPLGLFVGDALSSWIAGAVLTVTLWDRRARAHHGEADKRRSPSTTPARSPWNDVPFLAFLCLSTVLAIAFFQILGTMPVYLRDVFRMSEPLIGGILATNGAIIVIFEMLLVRALERRDHLRTVAVGALLICSGLALLACGRGVALAYGSTLVWTLGEMLALPASNTAVGFRAGTIGAVRYMGAYTLAFSVAFLVSPVLGSAVYESLGPGALWLGVGALGPLLFAGFFALSRAFRTP